MHKYKPSHEVRTILDRLTHPDKVAKIVGDFQPSPAYIRLCSVAQSNNRRVFSLCGLNGQAQRFDADNMQHILESVDKEVKAIHMLKLDRMQMELLEYKIKKESFYEVKM